MIATTAVQDRIVGLDFWRAVLMLIGVLLHGSIGLPSTGLFQAIDIVSQTFRMGAFFGIAGVLSALVLANRPSGAWLRRRFMQLGIPLAFGITILSPLVWLMMTALRESSAPLPPFSWHHLWFLAGLLLYSAIIHALIRTRLDVAIVARIDALMARGALRPLTALLFTAVASAALFGVAPRIMAATLSPSVFAGYVTLQLIAGYIPIFLLGFLVGRMPAFSKAMLTQTRSAAFVVGLVAAALLLWYAAILPRLDTATAVAGTAHLRFVAAAIGPPAAFVLILRSALGIRRVPALVARISVASYTIYLLHLPVGIAINMALQRFAPDPYLSYAIAVIGSTGLSFVFHEQVVRRSAALKLLLNGTPSYRPIRAAEPFRS